MAVEGSGAQQRRQVQDAARAYLRRQMVVAWHLTSDRADELLERWPAVATARALPPDHEDYWVEAETWALEEVRRR